MDKQQIIDYIMETPSNTNPAILSEMLDSMGGNEDSEMINVIMEVTPGMTFDFECNYSYQELSSFNDKSIIKLDENYTNGADNGYHGLAYFTKVDDYVSIFTMPASPYNSSFTMYAYKIDANQIRFTSNSISV